MDGAEDHAVRQRRVREPHGAAACGCEPASGEEFALTEEYEASETDSGRFLAAGAERRSGCACRRANCRAPPGLVRKILAQGENVIVESNSVVELVQPDVFLMLLDFSCEDFKPSSLRFMDRADAFVVIDRGINAPLWEDVARGHVGWEAAVPGEAAALRDGGGGGLRQGQNLGAVNSVERAGGSTPRRLRRVAGRRAPPAVRWCEGGRGREAARSRLSSPRQ